MDSQFWLNRWENNDIGFHRDAIHAQLQQFWPQLNLDTGSPVFVPLCGKSNDMAWLAAQGHRVIGVELSERAIDDFFAAHESKPDVEHNEDFTIKRAGQIELWCGDFFRLPSGALKDVAAVYDRASLVALPVELKRRYAAALTGLLPANADILLIGLDYDQSEMSGPPFATPAREVEELFDNNFHICVLGSIDALAQNENLIKRGLSALTETAYRLKRR